MLEERNHFHEERKQRNEINMYPCLFILQFEISFCVVFKFC